MPKHYSYRTEQTYKVWIQRYLLFHNKATRTKWANNEIRDFLAHLAAERKVAASTQNQAPSAILFLYGIVLQKTSHCPPTSRTSPAPNGCSGKTSE